MRSNYDCTGRQPFPQEGEWIPVCPPVERPWVTMREIVALQNPEYTGKVTERFDAVSGEVTFIVGRNPLPSESELKYCLAGYRAKDKNAVKSLTFLLSNNRDENDWVWLLKKGFARYEGHPQEALGMTAWRKSYVKTPKPPAATPVEKSESQPDDPLTQRIKSDLAQAIRELEALGKKS